ncbi:DUF11 domain-containing protein [Deinococcus pimensis]|uniref:DUF11 domain-containing protein n=1 Tax=Deinococcus pimensis TaxID=309888 RepID=UPI0004838C07|nr:DUF11 domain-containing protein [Deinococcus pimensis]
MRHLLTSIASTLLLLGSGAHAGTTSTPAGTVITNTATATATSEQGDTLNATSNTVQTSVQSVCAVSVLPNGTLLAPGQTTRILSGQTATFTYQVRNTGNATFTYDLAAALDAASEFTLPAGSVTLEPAAPLTLAMGDVATVRVNVATIRTTRGAAYPNLIASCPGAPLTKDEDNVARLDVDGFPTIEYTKTFSAASVKPGDLVTVTLTARNTGNAPARDVVLQDTLDTPALLGLSLEPGGVTSSPGTAVVTYTAGGNVWTTSATGGIGTRLTVPTLAEGATASLSFRMRVATTATPGLRTNVATLSSPDAPNASATATVAVSSAPALALGPDGNALATPGGEGSSDDTQTRGNTILGQPVCIPHTLLNNGNLTDRVTLTAALTAGAGAVTFTLPDGTPLAQPVTLTPGQSVDVRACTVPTTAGTVSVTLTATSSVGAAPNRTVDVLSDVQAQPITLAKTVTPGGFVPAGTLLTYTLTARNPYPFALSDARFTDTLDAHLGFVGASDSGALAGSAVTWTFPTLAPGETRLVTVQARVRTDTADDTQIVNCFDFTAAEVPAALTSPCVTTPVWTSRLSLTKSVSPDHATVGDRLTYTLRVTNASATASLRDVRVVDALPAVLAYLSGTSRVDGAALADPTVDANGLTWILPALAPGATATLTFDTRLLPGAHDALTNTAHATALGTYGLTTAVASNVATAAALVVAGPFATRAELVGRVYIDNDRDGVYDLHVDVPVRNARVILENGRGVLTDAQGRYRLAEVREGFTALRLDPNSTVNPAAPSPQDGGRRGTRGVLVIGLTNVDFPLAPLSGRVDVDRETTVVVGPVTITKTVSLQPGSTDTYVVRLHVRAASALPALTVEDPLPRGATLLDGTPLLTLTPLPVGDTTMTYRFRLADPSVRFTDPTVTWRTK